MMKPRESVEFCLSDLFGLSLPMVGFLPLEAVDPLSPSSPALGLREVVASIAPFFVGFSPE
ncbi:BnaC03g24190D [Brassica napus]|uniref:BnaC03g24190D protein n=1 Tax=Brassica napus TaxID=3708 RepID=A0A078I2F2_BRANA|nr:BnaC03g24190D [Brassica napus]